MLFDLFVIATKWEFWHQLILKMFDISAPYWDSLWLLFIVMGGAVFLLGMELLIILLADKSSLCGVG